MRSPPVPENTFKPPPHGGHIRRRSRAGQRRQTQDLFPSGSPVRIRSSAPSLLQTGRCAVQSAEVFREVRIPREQSAACACRDCRSVHIRRRILCRDECPFRQGRIQHRRHICDVWHICIRRRFRLQRRRSAVLEFREESDSYRAYTLEIVLSYDGFAGSSAAGPDTIGTGIIFGRDGVPLDCVRRGSGDIELEDGSTVSAETYVRTDGGYTYMYHVGEKCRILEISVQTADMSSGCWLSLSGR